MSDEWFFRKDQNMVDKLNNKVSTEWILKPNISNNEELAQFKEFSIEEQKINILMAYAGYLDQFMYEEYKNHPHKIAATTINKIFSAWKKAQSQKLIIQSDTESSLLFSRMAKSFITCIFIGDIDITDEEYKILIYYFRHLSDVEKKSATYQMQKDPYYAIALVQIGMRHYNEDFWPDVERVLGVQLDGNKQKTLRENFISVLDYYGKIHLEEDKRIWNILMHGFISDFYASKFFNMLYKYYRIDLHRNLENNNGMMINKLLSYIQENKNNEYLAQTQYAVQKSPERCADIINNLLYLLDMGFHDNDFREPTTRLHRLLNQWMQSDENFKIVLYKDERSRISSEKRFSSPYFRYDSNTEKILLVIPSQLVDNEDQEKLEWLIRTDHEVKRCPVTILEEGITGAKTDKLEEKLPISEWFDEITMKIIDPISDKEFCNAFQIPSESVRFFDPDGMSRNPNHMPTGNITCIIKKGFQIQSYAWLDSVVKLRDYDIAYLKLETGDIIHISDGNYYIAGQKFVEGIGRSASIRDVEAEADGKRVPIYANLPEIRFTAKPELVAGMLIIANGVRYSVRNNLPEFIDLGSGTEEKGCVLNLKDYLPDKAGIYHLVINFSDQRYDRIYDFVYIPDFSVNFHYLPYIFQSEGSISINCPNFTITPLQNDIQLNENGNAFIFPIDQDHLDLSFSAQSNDNEISFFVKVPCLCYSFGNGKWDTEVLKYKMEKELPNEILFDFPDDELIVSLTNEEKDSIKLTKESDGFFHYPTNAIRNYKISDQSKIDVYLNSPEIQNKFESKKLFMTVVFKSFIEDKRITADFDAGILEGYLDIVGKGNYFINIFCDNSPIFENIPLIGNKFALTHNILNGNYRFDVYEKEEDEFGLVSEAKKLDSFSDEIIDIHNLTGKSLKINNLLIKKYKEFKAYDVQRELIIRNLEKDETHGKQCYYGFLAKMNIKVRVFFPDLNDLSLAYITYWDDSNMDYFDFLYGTISHNLLIEQGDSYPTDLYDRYWLLNCDEKIDWNTPNNMRICDLKSIFEVSVE